MSGEYLLLKWLHILSSAVLFGTGAGIAFFFIRANRTGDANVIATVGKDVVLADAVFTATAVVLQPLTGLAMVRIGGYPWMQPWICASIVLYVFVGCCWLPVVWLQIRMRDLATIAAATASTMPAAYQRYYRWWCVLGWPAFLGILVIFYLMVVKPELWST
jgi:uncharacterized membrane protein